MYLFLISDYIASYYLYFQVSCYFVCPVPPSADLIIVISIQWALAVNCQSNLTRFVFHNLFLTLAIFTICCSVSLLSLINFWPYSLPLSVSLLSLTTVSLSVSSRVSVLWPSEALWHASKAPARLHLPASRPAEEGAPVHCYPAHLPGAAVGHQNLTRCHRLPHDGEVTFPSLHTCTLSKTLQFYRY